MSNSKPEGYYVDQANAYIDGVISGKIRACKWVILACERQRRDLKREDWSFEFDVKRAERVCRFVELLPHIKGPLANARKLIELQPWQCFILTTVFGWVDKETRLRRFKVVYTELPRKNGKSTLSSGVALYMLCADGESGADVFSAATHREQAKIVWGDAAEMVNRSPDLRRHLGVEANKRAIFQTQTASKFVPIARESRGNHDGLNVHCGIVDELHGHKTADMWNVLLTGLGARSQPILWAITTAGFDRSGICYDRRTYATKILDQVMQDESFFGVIWTIDEEDDWTDPASWEKSNPNWGVSLNKSLIEDLAKSAEQMVTGRNNFLTKHLNVWVSADTAWMDMRAWDKCADPELDEADFADDPCWMAVDLAVRTDIAAACRLYTKDIEEDGRTRRHYYAFMRYYMPESAVMKSQEDRYQLWEAEGRFVLSPGSSNDLDMIECDLKQEARRVNLQDLCFDPWNAAQIYQRLEKDGVPVVEMRPTTSNLSDPMKELESAVLDGRFHFNGDPILTWMASNVVAHTDARGNIYPKKERSENKIDGIFAILMAMARVSAKVPEPPQFQAFVF